ncbi:MAG: PDZ domain-containing protein [Tannerella sp.]|jgi:hypothetical protein|nr:PDZ domain-containing protein [Tannerella sp.]
MNKKIFYIIITITILGCSGGSKSNVSLQTETADTAAIPKDAIPIVYHDHIYFPSQVDSISGNFLFDTGADGLYLDSTFYATNRFRKFKFANGTLPGAGAGKPQKVLIIKDTVSFTIQNYDNNLSFIPVFLLKPILGDFADGIIGREPFLDKIMEINYFHEYIRLHNDVSAIDTSGYERISMKKERNRLFVPATIHINETVSIQEYLLLDLGSGGSIDITSPTADKYKLPEEITGKISYFTKYGGISGQSSSYYFRANSIEIGKYRLDNVTMRYTEDKSGALSSDKHAGLLGNEVLERFDIIIDFKKNDLYFKPNSNYGKPFDFSKLGFGYVDRNVTMDAWIVTGLFKGSNAEIAGLEIDDKIISINGIDIHDISLKKQSDFWKKTDKASLLIMRNGEEKRIEFDLKYVL